MSYPSWLRWYKKPSYVDVNAYATALVEKAGTSTNPNSPRASFESSSKRRSDIPTKLSLERILQNKTCSPMSLYDFYMYLKYIEHSSENLEFYVWFKNYEAGRLTAQNESSTASIAQASNNSQADLRSEKTPHVEMIDLEAQRRTGDDELLARIAGLIDPAAACGGGSCGLPRKNLKQSMDNESSKSGSFSQETGDIEARRTELKNIAKLYLVREARSELNIPAPMRSKVLKAIEKSTDVEFLRPVADHCYLLLKNGSHRNFIRLGVSNGTFETLCVATNLGIVLTVAGFLYMLLIAFVDFRKRSRWDGIGAWPLWALGFALILAGLRGTCFFLLLFQRRQRLPWEWMEEDETAAQKRRNPILRFLGKMMIFDRKMKVKDDNLRRLQKKIVLQSMLGGILGATLLCVVFLSLPIWKKL